MTLSSLHIAYRRSALFTLAMILLCFMPSGASQAAELLVVTRPNCPYCKAWEIQVGSVYDKTEEGRAAPLRRIPIEDIAGAAYVLEEPVLYTPTFVLLDEEMEVGRIVGYSDEAAFWGLLDELLTRLAVSR
jgi:hypothetical protein